MKKTLEKIIKTAVAGLAALTFSISCTGPECVTDNDCVRNFICYQNMCLNPNYVPDQDAQEDDIYSDINFSDADAGCTPRPCFQDLDGDGYGTTKLIFAMCGCSGGFVDNDDDCDDNDPDVYPGAPEIKDGKDNDGDGIIDNGFVTGDHPIDVFNDKFSLPKYENKKCSIVDLDIEDNNIVVLCDQPVNKIGWIKLDKNNPSESKNALFYGMSKWYVCTTINDLILGVQQSSNLYPIKITKLDSVKKYAYLSDLEEIYNMGLLSFINLDGESYSHGYFTNHETYNDIIALDNMMVIVAEEHKTKKGIIRVMDTYINQGEICPKFYNYDGESIEGLFYLSGTKPSAALALTNNKFVVLSSTGESGATLDKIIINSTGKDNLNYTFFADMKIIFTEHLPSYSKEFDEFPATEDKKYAVIPHGNEISIFDLNADEMITSLYVVDPSSYGDRKDCVVNDIFVGYRTAYFSLDDKRVGILDFADPKNPKLDFIENVGNDLGDIVAYDSSTIYVSASGLWNENKSYNGTHNKERWTRIIAIDIDSAKEWIEF